MPAEDSSDGIPAKGGNRQSEDASGARTSAEGGHRQREENDGGRTPASRGQRPRNPGKWSTGASAGGSRCGDLSAGGLQRKGPDFYTELVVYLTQLCQELHNAVHVLGNDVRPLLQLPTFRQTCAALVKKVDNTVELATAALRQDYDAVAQLAKSLPYNPEDPGHGLEHLGRLVQELAVKAAELVPVTTRALPKRLGSEPAWIMESHLKALEAEATVEVAKDAEQCEREQTHAKESMAPRLSIAIETLLSVSDLLGKLQQRIIVLQYR